jgi:hypothetical protein
MAAMGALAEDVRVAALHLVRNCGGDVVEGEGAGFLGHAGVKDDLEQQVAEFVLEVGHVAAVARIGDLISFLDRKRRDAGEGLGSIPFAAGDRIAQPRHDRAETLDGGQSWRLRYEQRRPSKCDNIHYVKPMTG